jgi:hypothetical protein
VVTVATTLRPLPTGELGFVSQTFFGGTDRIWTWKAASNCFCEVLVAALT